MASPFPGMDPYLEDPNFWPDFHQRYINFLSEAIADGLPEYYEAAIGERIRLEKRLIRQREIRYADAVIRRSTARLPRAMEAKAGIATLEPVSIPLLTFEEVREVFLQIRQTPGRKIVTVIEVLSPANKVGAGRDDYLAKRDSLLRQPIHLVELDLLVGGRRLPALTPLPAGDYYAIVARSERRPKNGAWGNVIADVYAWTVKQRLPLIPIPLLAPDLDIHVNLQQVFATAYDRGRFARRLDYARAPKARLGKTSLAWAAKLGKRARR
jgi:hypothetical protein